MDEEIKTPETVEEAAPAEKPKKKSKSSTALAAELKAANEKLAEQEDAYKRMLAEYANYKRRTEQEKEQLGLFTKGELLKTLLPVLDNLQRAAAAPAGDEYKAGVEMIIHQFEKTLADMGLTEIEAENAPFDPERHFAVMREDADGVDTETVTEVFQKGYCLGDKVLRPAMVKVAN
ncbi:MAG: nucleotide exchange factor GrpE [Clostridia bacterium]|nr:nucleotide exchange factor GrpE [Clostridia bacterium]